MIKLLPALALLICVTDANAQAQTKYTGLEILKHIEVSKPVANQGHKGTASQWRMKAASTYQDQGGSMSMQDSSFYKYSNHRGSRFDDIQFTLYDYSFESTMYFDTAFKYYDIGNGLDLQDLYVFEYDNRDRKMKYSYLYKPSGSPIENYHNEIAERDANGNITRRYLMNWERSSQKWDTTGIGTLIYDNNNRLLSDSFSSKINNVFRPMEKSVYTYDANGNRLEWLRLSSSGAGLDSAYRNISTYNNQNMVVTSEYMRYDQNGWANFRKDSSGYNSAGVFNYQVNQEWDSTSAVWIYTNRQERFFDHAGQLEYITFSSWDDGIQDWEEDVDVDVKYDNHGNNTRLEIYAYYGGNKAIRPYYVVNYYYENYSGVGITDKADKSTFEVYPNPASNTINIRTKAPFTGQVSLTGMTGQTVSVQEIARSTQHISMNISGLPAGNYILSLTGGTGEAPLRKMICIN